MYFNFFAFAAAFARILGTNKEGDKLEKDQNFKKGDKTCSKVWSPGTFCFGFQSIQ